MKHVIVWSSAIFLIAGYSSALAQLPPPPGAGDKTLEDRNIKNRSIELERIKRDANKPDRRNQPEIEKMPEAKFQEIKEDFEQVQFAQNEIITAYTKGKEIDYAKISLNAEQIIKRGTRLKENLFPPVREEQREKKAKSEKRNTELPTLPQDVKALIVEMDNSLAAFVSNPMFTNPQVVNSADNEKAQSDLEKLIRLSIELNKAAKTASMRED